MTEDDANTTHGDGQAAPDESTEKERQVQAAAGAEGQDHDTFDIPARLPILPIRDTVAFPGTVMPVRVNREKSRRVLDLALAGSRLVAVVAQRAAETEDPRLDDLYRVGTACVILKMLKMSDGSETIIVHGLRRVGIEKITAEEEYREAAFASAADRRERTDP